MDGVPEYVDKAVSRVRAGTLRTQLSSAELFNPPQPTRPAKKVKLLWV